jgi:hypothetical protein
MNRQTVFESEGLAMRRTRCLLFALLLFGAAWLPHDTHAGDWINPGEETFTISGGVFLPSFDTSAQVDTSLGIGTGVNLEDDLGLTSDETTFWGDASWRFARKHRLTVAYFGFTRDANAVANKELTIGDETFPVGASLSSEFKLQIVPIAYSYSFMNREKYEFGASLGLHWYTMDFSVAGSASLNDEDLNDSVSVDANAPMPLLGLFFDYHFTPKWSVGFHGQFFALDLNDDTFSFSGTVTNLRLSTEYWVFNHVGLGVAVNWFKLDVDLDDSDWKGSVDYEYWGPQIYATIRF